MKDNKLFIVGCIIVGFAFIVLLFLAINTASAFDSGVIQENPATPTTTSMLWWQTGITSTSTDANGLTYWNTGSDFYTNPTNTGVHMDTAGYKLYVIKAGGASFAGGNNVVDSGGNNSGAVQCDAGTDITGGNYRVFKCDVLPAHPNDVRKIELSSINASYRRFFGFVYGNDDLSTYTEGQLVSYMLQQQQSNNNFNTRIIAQETPLHGTTSATANVQFKFTYYYGNATQGVTTAGIEVRDITSGFIYSTTEDTINASGQSEYNHTFALQSGHYHMWRAYLRNASTTPFSTGWYGFNVVTVNSFFPTAPPALDSSKADATSSVATAFFGQQGYLAQKFPFAYFYNIADILQKTSTSSTENNFPTLGISVGTSTGYVHLSNMTLLSSSTVSQYAGSSNVAVFRLIMTAILWIFFITEVWLETKWVLHKH